MHIRFDLRHMRLTKLKCQALFSLVQQNLIAEFYNIVIFSDIDIVIFYNIVAFYDIVKYQVALHLCRMALTNKN